MSDQESKDGRIRVGIGGWVFPPWRGTFYPQEVRQADELAYASRHVTAIEINGTFYRLQTPASYKKWHDAVPDDFVFSLKGSRFITHRNDLSTAAPFMERFFHSGLAELGPKLGPILWQFAPGLAFDEGNLTAFLDALPKTLGNRKLRHVLEVRSSSFKEPAFARLMERHAAAIAWVEDAKVPLIETVTTDFVYARLRQCREDEPTGYAPDALDRIAARFRAHAEAGRDCFVYFINGAKTRAPHAAMALIERLRAR
ncbi:MAG TPA: DUF72 domain-containing protein [Stellaceae bacterium]|nr:DUF72 domain-containing protein [Stellaceae bacterium]